VVPVLHPTRPARCRRHTDATLHLHDPDCAIPDNTRNTGQQLVTDRYRGHAQRCHSRRLMHYSLSLSLSLSPRCVVATPATTSRHGWPAPPRCDERGAAASAHTPAARAHSAAAAPPAPAPAPPPPPPPLSGVGGQADHPGRPFCCRCRRRCRWHTGHCAHHRAMMRLMGRRRWLGSQSWRR
jgi:hypothetical protein